MAGVSVWVLHSALDWRSVLKCCTHDTAPTSPDDPAQIIEYADFTPNLTDRYKQQLQQNHALS